MHYLLLDLLDLFDKSIVGSGNLKLPPTFNPIIGERQSCLQLMKYSRKWYEAK